MFDTLTGSVGAGNHPTHVRSVWIHTAPGVWALNPVLTEAELPDPADHRRLTDLPPGAGLAREIEHAVADTGPLNDAELVDAITGVEHLSRWAAGVQARLVAEFARRRPGDEPTAVASDRIETGSRWAPDELGLALERTRLDTKTLIGRSLQLTDLLSDTLAALQAGTIDQRRAFAICESTLQLPEEKALAVEAAVLPNAPGRTLRQLRDRLRRAVHRVDPDGEYQRHKAAHQERRVTISSREEGMSALWITASSEDAEAAFVSVTRLAQAMGPGSGRTLDERRSDISIQLLQGRLTLTALDDVVTAVSPRIGTATETSSGSGTGDDVDSAAPSTDSETVAGAATAAATATTTAGIPDQTLIDAVAAALAQRPQMHETVRKPLIQVVVGLDSLIGESEHPAELLGHGPINATTARALAADGIWKRLVTDPPSGALLDYGRTTYRPPTALAEFVDARDQYCRFPTCTRRVRELDHHQRRTDGGPTNDDNLNGYCPSHHLLKEHQDWHVLAHPDGRLTWITPTGLRYTSDPYDYRPFTDPLPDLGETDQDPNPAGDATSDDPDNNSDNEDDDPPPF